MIKREFILKGIIFIIMPILSMISVITVLPKEINAAPKEDYCVVPSFVGKNIPPLVMLVMGRDHKLYYEAYNDASDINEDGKLDIGYDHSIEYYGYFDPYKCYEYTGSGANAKFVPVALTTDKFCSSGQWSGNVLNWLTMSRMDVLRKVLYGGYRSTDSSSSTVLERAFIPQDAHSWGKEFTGRLCYDGSTYTHMCMTDLDCETGSTCVDKSINLIGIPAPDAPTICTASPVSWNKRGKILIAKYRHSNNSCGTNHTNLINSYEPANLYSYYYVNNFYHSTLNPRRDHDGSYLNYFAVVEFKVTPADAGDWQFAIDGDDGVEVEIDGEVVATYYGCHGPCNCRRHSGTKHLSRGWHRLIVRHSERTGWEGMRVWYKKPGDRFWTIFGNTLNLRAPNILSGNECSIKTREFIETGEPSTGTIVSGSGKRHLFCNTTLSANGDPLLRLLKNRTNRIWEWASKERPVCDNSLGTPTDYVVRVEVCKSGMLEKNCKEYPQSPPAKPVGLLQKYAEGDKKVCSKSFKTCNNDDDCDKANGEICTVTSKMFFGLITGSNTKNLSGGVLRKNIWNIFDEVVDTTGVFQDQENVEGNIIRTLNRLKTVGFSYRGYKYNCGWITTRPLREGECNMWGNPIAEMLYESTRYFAGKTSPTRRFLYSTNNDKGLQLPKLGTRNKPWRPPYEIYPQCAKPFQLILSDVNPSYDSDSVPGSSFSSFSGDLPDLNVSFIADFISNQEGINGNYFIGESGGLNDHICTEKSVSGFSNIRGLCPEEPTKQGSYYSAAMAYYGKELLKVCSNDRTKVCSTDADCPSGGTCSHNMDLTTYSVALSSPVPQIKIKTDSGSMTLVPIGKSVSGCLRVYNACASKCTLSYDPNQGLQISNCSANSYCPSNQIVDFYVDTITDNYGKFRINFEDVEQGADHDMDAIVEYEYCVGSACNPAIPSNQVKVKLNSTYASGCIDQVLGFVISGSTEDGTYLAVRDVDSGATDSNTPAVVSNMPLTWEKTFTLSGSEAAGLLKNPLWYAAKWGGFEDLNHNKIPDLPEEWDRDGNGEPDTYYFVANPLKLEKKLEQAFTDILKRASSGTAVSVLASGEGQGANLLQAVFYPKKTYGTDVQTELSWTGRLQNLWYYIDPFFNLSTIREDTNNDSKLNLVQDYITNIYFDTSVGKTMASLCEDSDGDGVCDNPKPTVDFEELKNLWEAGERLFQKAPSDRTIYTNIDDDSTLDNFDVITTSNPTLESLLNASSTDEANIIIRYIRGEDLKVCSTSTTTVCTSDSDCPEGETCTPLRNRTVTIGSNTNTWKLGDIVNSTPRIQSWVPLNDYYEKYDDSSYKDFTKTATYTDRGMVYVGANDGMLHAFYLGKLEMINDLDNPKDKAKLTDPDPSDGISPGDEVWAFIPKNALPYLKYLMEPDYCHIYYVDASPYIFDASIGTTGCSEANYWDCPKTTDTWRTILIGSMRLGGACRDASSTCTDCVKTPISNAGYSSYFALDITDQNNPKLLWEFSDPSLGFSSTGPLIVKVSPKTAGGSPDNTKNGRWFVVLASGPTGPIDTTTHEFLGKSEQNLKIFILDLKEGTVLRTIDTGITEAFGGSQFNSTLDLDDDYQDDVVYLSYVKKVGSGSSVSWTGGGILRLVTYDGVNATSPSIDPTYWKLSTLIDLNNGPVSTSPVFARDRKHHILWVFFGTGRYFHKADDLDGRRRIYGIKEPCYLATTDNIDPTCTTTMSESSLTDATSTPPTVTEANGATFKGWYVNLDCASSDTGCTYRAPSGYGAERVITTPLVSPAGAVLFTTFSPTSDVCGYGGNSYIWAVDYRTGGQAPGTALEGKALLQLSTGEIKEVPLESAFTERGNRRSASFSGVPPQGQGLSVMVPPEPLKKFIFIKEK